MIRLISKQKSDSIICHRFCTHSGIEKTGKVCNTPADFSICRSSDLYVPVSILFHRTIAYVSPSQVSPMTCFRRKDIPSILTATIPFYITVQCSGLAPDSLVQQNKNACLRLQPDDIPLQSPVAHLPQKPELYKIVIITLSVYRNINSTCLSITRKEGCYESLRECSASVMIVSVLIYYISICVLSRFLFSVHL
jgi:hypothetical protein